jgi:hypothetical protein
MEPGKGNPPSASRLPPAAYRLRSLTLIARSDLSPCRYDEMVIEIHAIVSLEPPALEGDQLPAHAPSSRRNITSCPT